MIIALLKSLFYSTDVPEPPKATVDDLKQRMATITKRVTLCIGSNCTIKTVQALMQTRTIQKIIKTQRDVNPDAITSEETQLGVKAVIEQLGYPSTQRSTGNLLEFLLQQLKAPYTRKITKNSNIFTLGDNKLLQPQLRAAIVKSKFIGIYTLFACDNANKWYCFEDKYYYKVSKPDLTQIDTCLIYE